MSRITILVGVATCLLTATADAVQQSQPAEQQPAAGKVYEVGKDGLVIDGKLSKDDPPLAALKGAPH